MVKCHEDASWPNNLSLFALDIEGYWDQKNKVMKENRPPVLSSLSLEYFKIFYSLQGVPKMVQILTYFSSISEILSFLMGHSRLHWDQTKLFLEEYQHRE